MRPSSHRKLSLIPVLAVGMSVAGCVVNLPASGSAPVQRKPSQLATPTSAPDASGKRDVEAGPIWSGEDAEQKCPALATRENGTWTGGWRTTVPGQMSVCEIATNAAPAAASAASKRDVEAGPIWSQPDAEQKCPALATRENGKWTGGWRTTVPGQMSVCEIESPPSL